MKMQDGDILLGINTNLIFYFGTLENLPTRVHFVRARREEIHLKFPI
jgi:hypothetical protein